MDKLQKLTQYISKVVADDRLKPIHIAMAFALCDVWIIEQFQQPYRVSRRVLMQASKIRSKATYHKVIRELQTFGYLKYNPSYHPINASKVVLVMKDQSPMDCNR
jgi:hypothetical protein